MRLQGKSNGAVALVSTSKTGSWVRWTITDGGGGTWFIDRVGADPSASRLSVEASAPHLAELVGSSEIGADARWILTPP